MIERVLIHVGGPKGSGKTAFIEAVLAADRGPTLVARCFRDDALRAPRETSPARNPELCRYLDAGASGAALFAFPGGSGTEPLAFYETDLMIDYSTAVILEGDSPPGFRRPRGIRRAATGPWSGPLRSAEPGRRRQGGVKVRGAELSG